MARGNVSMPSRNEHSPARGVPFAGRDFMAPRSTLPYCRFKFVKLRKRGAQAQPFRIAGIHAGNEGSDKPVEQLVSEFAANERGDGLIFRRRLRAAQNFREQPPFRAGRKQRSGQQAKAGQAAPELTGRRTRM